MMQNYKMNVKLWSNKVFLYYNFVYLLWTARKESNKGFCHRSSKWTAYYNKREPPDCPKYHLKWSYSVLYVSFSTSACILETDGILIVLTIAEAKVEPSSPRKVSSSKSGAFSSSGKSSFSHGILIELLPVTIATVKCFLLSCCIKSFWPEKKMVANGNKYQLITLPSCKISIFFPSENGKNT